MAAAEDQNTLSSIAKSCFRRLGACHLHGRQARIEEVCRAEGPGALLFEIIDHPDELSATLEATRQVREGEADVLMKGLVGTDKFLKAVLDKQKGLLPPGAVMSYTCALELPKYPKLLFVSDTAVLPDPDLAQTQAMINYSVAMARRFGIECPKVALISATERGAFHAVDPGTRAALQDESAWPDQELPHRRPSDIFLACDPAAGEIKGVNTPINGEADVLIFPSLESANSFYKGLMLFAGAELAGLIQGTVKPVVVMSRSESAASKYYCVARA